LTKAKDLAVIAPSQSAIYRLIATFRTSRPVAMTMFSVRAKIAAAALLFFSLGSGAGANEPAGENGATAIAPSQTRVAVYRQVKELAEIGRRLFSDPSLSSSGRMSCASCHDPAHGFAPANGRSVQLGGKDLDRPGIRAVPTLTYKQATPQFTEHFHDSDEEGDESVDAGPTGGLTWDGRVDQLSKQASIPLFSPFEMANKDRAKLVASLEADYGASLRSVLGARMPQGPDGALDAAAKALEVYQQNAAEFFPYSSKYDAFLAGKAQLTEAEKRGLALFQDPTKGNCASCHISAPKKAGTLPQFTDDGLIALGAPRNMAIPANQDPAFFDLGLCGPERADYRDRADYCGLFKTPTLRNVALRKVFFHNGGVRSLREAVAFYVERDVKPEKWYPRRADGSIAKFDDLPAQYHENVNMDPPFGGKPGDAPALSQAEIDDVVAFLETLTDGFIASSSRAAASR
jgi:cytochrome c peroxidase